MSEEEKKELSDEVERLLEKTIENMKSDIEIKGSDYFRIFTGVKMEGLLKEYLESSAKGTRFESCIRDTAEYEFPDLVIADKIGIEVKTTDKDQWTSTGNSVLESARMKEVDIVYIFFAKLKPPIDFKYQRYERCLSGVVVTHYPRYKIDMQLEEGKTIFDIIGKQYDDLRKLDNPAKPILRYYKEQAERTNGQLWWMDIDDNVNSSISPPIVRVISDLSPTERGKLVCSAFAYFPEIFGSSNSKYSRLTMWLITENSVIAPNIRDYFSAGGKVDRNIGLVHFCKIPQIFSRLLDKIIEVKEILLGMDITDIEKYWHLKKNPEVSTIDHWLGLVLSHAKYDGFNIERFMNELLK